MCVCVCVCVTYSPGSAIFDRIGTKAWAAPYCAAALRLGIQSLAFPAGGLGGVVSPPSPSRRPGAAAAAAARPSAAAAESFYAPPPPVGHRHQPANSLQGWSAKLRTGIDVLINFSDTSETPTLSVTSEIARLSRDEDLGSDAER